MTPIRPLLPVQTGSQSLILKQAFSYLNNRKRYHSSIFTEQIVKFKYVIYKPSSAIVQTANQIYKKSNSTIWQITISIYRSFTSKLYQWPLIWPLFLSIPEKFRSFKKIISQQPIPTRGITHSAQIFALLYRSLILEERSIFTNKVTPIWPLLLVQTGSHKFNIKTIISQQPQEVHSQFLKPLYRSLFVK